MLASLVIDHLQNFSDKQNHGVAYIYCDYRRQEEQTPIKLIASVTKQLLRHQVSIPEEISKAYEHHQKKQTRSSFADVLDMAKSSMVALPRIHLMVDALDELGNAGQIRQSFIRSLRQLQDSHHFNLITTSRYIPSLALEFHQPLSIHIRASSEDIKKYVEGHVLDLPNCVRKSVELQEAISKATVSSVEGM